MEEQHPVDALFNELEERGVYNNMSGGDWVEDDVAANWDFMKDWAKELYQKFWAYKNMDLEKIHNEVGDHPDYYSKLLKHLSGEVQREEGIRVGKMGHRYVWSIPPLGLACWTAYKTINHFKKKHQRSERPYTLAAFDMFGEKTTSTFQAISNNYQYILNEK